MLESRLRPAGMAIATILLVTLVSLAIATGLPRGGPPAGAQGVPCESPNQDSNTGMTFDPDSAPPDAPVAANLTDLPSSGEVRNWALMWDWSGTPGDDIIAQGEIPASSTAYAAGFTVPSDATPGTHDVTFCYQHPVIPQSVGDPWFRADAEFTVEAGPPTPTPSPTPTPAPPLAIPGLVAIPLVPTPPSGLQVLPPPLLDLSIFGIEITQAIQCFNPSDGLKDCPDNSLPVALEKSTVARTYLRASDIPLPFELAGVPVRLHLMGGGQEVTLDSHGIAIANSLIEQGSSGSADFWFRIKANNDFPVSFYAEVDPDNTIVETNENNNRFPPSGTIDMVFQKTEDQNIVGWRMRYHPPGFDGNQYAGGWGVDGGGAEYLEAIWPVRSGHGVDYSIKSGYLNRTTEITFENSGKILDLVNYQWVMQNLFWIVYGKGDLTGADQVFVWTPNDHYVRGRSNPMYIGGIAKAALGTDKPGTSIDDPGYGAVNFAHEVTHNREVKHTATGATCQGNDSSDSSSATDPDWPYANASIQEFGYNPDTGKIFDPDDSNDVMSYCYGGDKTDNAWISPFHWQKLFDSFDTSSLSQPGAISPSSADRSLAVTVTVDNPDVPGDAGSSFGDLYLAEAGVEIAPPPGPWSVELRNGGTVLGSRTFDANFGPPDTPTPPGIEPQPDDEPRPEAGVSFIMPWAEGATSVALVHNGQTLDEVTVSANSPTVAFTNPVGPETWADGSTHTLSWQGSDTDGDDLSYSLIYSTDGDFWEIIAAGLTDSSYDVETDSLAGSDAATFRVVATDGINIGSDETPPITVPNKPPFVVITTPENGTVVIPGGLVVLSGSAVDLEEGSLPDDSYEWSSDLDGDLGTGASLPLTSLSNGLHTIILTATDSGGESASESVQVLVAVPAIIDFQPDAVSPGGDPPDVTVMIVLPFGYPTDTIDLDSLQMIVGETVLDPTSATILGDTDSDGLIELELTFNGGDVRDALPGGTGPASVTVMGELENGTPLQGSDTVSQLVPGDVDCDGDSDAVDALQVLRVGAGLPADADCIAAADVDCDGDEDAVDALNILRANAGLSVNKPEDCPAIGGAAAASSGFGLPALPSFLWLSVVFVVPAFVVTRRRMLR